MAAVDCPQPAAIHAASLCIYIRAWLIQVSGQVELVHQHCHILTLPRQLRTQSSVLSRPASYAVPLCTYIRVWLKQVSWHVRLKHQHCHRPRIRPLVDRRRNTGTGQYLWTIYTGMGKKGPIGTPLNIKSPNLHSRTSPQYITSPCNSTSGLFCESMIMIITASAPCHIIIQLAKMLGWSSVVVNWSPSQVLTTNNVLCVQCVLLCH